MPKSFPVMAAVALATAATALSAADAGGPLKPDGPIARSYVEAARALAAADDNPVIRWNFRVWCETGYRTVGEAGPGQIVDKPVDRERDMVSPKGFVDPRDDRPMPAGGVRFLDNAWYFGTDLTGMVVVKVSEGLILFDALTNRADMQSQGVDQMKAAGLDPSTIRYIFIGHEHPDHYGGINLILENYAPGAKVVATEVAAKAILGMREAVANGSTPPRLFGRPPAGLTSDQIKALALDGIPTRIDLRVSSAPDMPVGTKRLDLGGGTSVLAIQMPGHTKGQMQLIVPVQYKGKNEKILLWSGNDNFDFAAGYAASSDFVRAVARWEGASAFINTHGYQGAAFAHLRDLKRNPTGPNPFVMGVEGVQRFLGVYGECQRAQAARRAEGSWLEL